ncbi:hypothetical protein [Vibrio rotiferianus]|uniref:hypothetical protein n=1 Tax=Vibrio rotiferianus TaxID=190895 RepID=UPI00148D89EA|nr:hypothetical protein [Vibrio rotiferianus]NOH68753.1 hypothetical protein [Vibrio rotiferianus]
MNNKLIEIIENCGLEVEDVMPIIDAVKSSMHKAETVQDATILLREAIQIAEQFGLVRTEDGAVITGALPSEHGVVLVRE